MLQPNISKCSLSWMFFSLRYVQEQGSDVTLDEKALDYVCKELWQTCSDLILKSGPSQICLLFCKLQSRCMLTRQFSPKVANKDRDKEKTITIYCLWMVDNERGREW